jgi:hypothetical protein
MSKIRPIAPTAMKKVMMKPMVPGLYQVSAGSTVGVGVGVAARSAESKMCMY